MSPDPFDSLLTNRYAFLIAIDSLAKGYPDYPPGGLVRSEFLASDYVAPSRSSEVLGTTLSLGPLAVIIVCIRFVVVKRWPGLSIGPEDWMLVPAVLFLIGLIFVHVYGAMNGIGKHMYDTTWTQLKLDHRLSQPNLQLYAWSIYFSKLSNLFFTRRITPQHMRKTHYTIYGLFIFQTVWTLLASFLVLFSCRPFRATWDLEYSVSHKTKCFNSPHLAMAASALFVTGDLATMVLPIMLVLQLQLPRRTKIGVTFLFAFGIFVCVANMVKIKYFVHQYTSWDSTWNAVDVVKWSSIEACFALITVCLPALDMVLVKLIPKSLLQKFRDADARRMGTPSTENYLSAAKMEFVAHLDPRNRDEKDIEKVLGMTDDETISVKLQAFMDSDHDLSLKKRYSTEPDEHESTTKKPYKTKGQKRDTLPKEPTVTAPDERDATLKKRNSTSWLSIESGEASPPP